MKNPFILALSWLLLSNCVLADEGAPEVWKAESPREEIRPEFAWDTSGGPDKGSLVIRADGREGLMGFWTRWQDAGSRRRLG